MATIMFQNRFWHLILDGSKVNTIRPARKRPILPGENLSLRGWEGKAYRSKQRELLIATCLAVREIIIFDTFVHVEGYGDGITKPEELDQFARFDGFESFQEMREFQKALYPENLRGMSDRFRGTFIQWGENSVLSKHLNLIS